MPILWTFEDKEKLKLFSDILNENDIPFDLLSKGKQISSEDGLIVSVDDDNFRKAKKLLLSHRKRISNRHNK